MDTLFFTQAPTSPSFDFTLQHPPSLKYGIVKDLWVDANKTVVGRITISHFHSKQAYSNIKNISILFTPPDHINEHHYYAAFKLIEPEITAYHKLFISVYDTQLPYITFLNKNARLLFSLNNTTVYCEGLGAIDKNIILYEYHTKSRGR